jgi:hypothetical protein
MNATQLSAWAAGKKNGTNKSSLIRQLQTGSMPPGQGSSLAPVNVAPVDTYLTNAVPFVDYPQHIAPVGTPGRQNLRNAPTAQTPPWISVPLCSQGRPVPKHVGLGVSGSGGGAVLNLPSKSGHAPRLFTAAAAGG